MSLFYFLSFWKIEITCIYKAENNVFIVCMKAWLTLLFVSYFFILSSLILYYAVKSSWACTQSLRCDAFLEYVGTMKNNISYKKPIRSNIEFLKYKTYTYSLIHHQESPWYCFTRSVIIVKCKFPHSSHSLL